MVLTLTKLIAHCDHHAQCLDNQSKLGNGTAATVYIKPVAEPMPANINNLLKEKRTAGQKNTLTKLKILDLAKELFPHVEKHTEYKVLRFLLESPEFSVKKYDMQKHDLLQPPEPMEQLPYGPENQGMQYLLGSVPIPEASYEANVRLINEWFEQLGWDSPEEKRRIAEMGFVAWIGNRLTIDCLWGIFQMRTEEENLFEWLDFSVFIFGWLHLQIAFANSLYKQYKGSSQTRGLKQAFDLLGQKGLANISTKGPFQHDLEEALYHIAEAHICQDWLEVGCVAKLEDLWKRTPEELHQPASKIVRT